MNTFVTVSAHTDGAILRDEDRYFPCLSKDQLHIKDEKLLPENMGLKALVKFMVTRLRSVSATTEEQNKWQIQTYYTHYPLR
jgi:hypothetical protein